MSKILLDKVHARCKEIAIEKNIDLTKIKDREIWISYLCCFFQAAKEIRDDFYDKGLFNTANAMGDLIKQQRKYCRDPDEQKAISEILDVEEFSDQ